MLHLLHPNRTTLYIYYFLQINDAYIQYPAVESEFSNLIWMNTQYILLD